MFARLRANVPILFTSITQHYRHHTLERNHTFACRNLFLEDTTVRYGQTSFKRLFAMVAKKKSAFIACADGMEEIEAVTVFDVLHRGGLHVETVSVMSGKLEVKGAHGLSIRCDRSINDVQGDHYDLIVLPGGLPGVTHLKDCPALISKLRDQLSQTNRWTGAICAAPGVVLGSHKLAGSHKMIGYPGIPIPAEFQSDTKEPVLISGNLVTSLGPGTAMQFALKLVEVTQGKTEADRVQKGLLYEAPPSHSG